MSRMIWVPDYGASDSLYMRIEIPEPGEPGYICPADRIAGACAEDPRPEIIAREQAIEEALDRQRLPEPGPEPERELEAAREDWGPEWPAYLSLTDIEPPEPEAEAGL